MVLNSAFDTVPSSRYDRGMTSHALKKSSFTLPTSELPLVQRLKKQLHLESNTAVIRHALKFLESQMERKALRAQFKQASALVKTANADDYAEWDILADEGLE